jgi:tetratricopeptide (TPR) repeat protein
MASNHSAQDVLNSASAEEHDLRKNSAGYSRETVLLSCIGLLVLLLVVTAFASRMYHKQEHELADEWYAKGEAQFHSGNALEAAKDYRNALVYSESNTIFQFHLAQALTAANPRDTDEEARSYLLNLLAESPGSGEINLELAHISARQKGAPAIQDTQRYYSGAIYGVWESGNPLMNRWDARRDLCDYLLARGMVSQAQPQAIALAQDVPLSDLARQKSAAQLLMRVGLWDRALTEYRLILTSHRRDPDALAGEGISAFQLGQYPLAAQELSALPPSMRKEPDVGAALAESREVEAVSPFLNGLLSRERARRTLEALTRANALLQNCAQTAASAPAKPASATQPPTKPSSKTSGTPANSPEQAAPSATAANDPLAQLQAVFAQNSRAWRELNFIRNPDQIDAAMSWVFQVESAAAQSCGASPNLVDRALLLIAKSRTGSNA